MAGFGNIFRFFGIDDDNNEGRRIHVSRRQQAEDEAEAAEAAQQTQQTGRPGNRTQRSADEQINEVANQAARNQTQAPQPQPQRRNRNAQPQPTQAPQPQPQPTQAPQPQPQPTRAPQPQPQPTQAPQPQPTQAPQPQPTQAPQPQPTQAPQPQPTQAPQPQPTQHNTPTPTKGWFLNETFIGTDDQVNFPGGLIELMNDLGVKPRDIHFSEVIMYNAINNDGTVTTGIGEGKLIYTFERSIGSGSVPENNKFSTGVNKINDPMVIISPTNPGNWCYCVHAGEYANILTVRTVNLIRENGGILPAGMIVVTGEYAKTNHEGTVVTIKVDDDTYRRPTP